MRRRVFALSLAAAIPLFASSAAAESLVRAPYIQMLSPTSATLVWTTDVAADSLVRYGSTPGNLDQIAPSAAAVTQHEITLSGLSPATRYYYSVGSAANPLAGDATHHFDTAPPVGSKSKIRAWIVGDSGTGGTKQAQVRDAMLAHVGAHPPQLFLHMGDIAYNSGTTAEFTDHFFAPYAGILRNTVVWPTLGNHEGTNASSATQTGPYYTAFILPKAAEAGGLPSGTEAYYSFDHGNIHFIVLNSQDVANAPGSPMLTWLTADLAATAQDWIIAYWHHPPYTKGSHNSDTESQLVNMRKNVLPVLEAGGVDLVLSGHSHIYERSFLVDGAYDTPTTSAGHIKDPGDGKPLGDGPYRKLTGANAHDGAVYVVAGHGGTGLSGTGNHPLMYFSELVHGSCILDVQANRLGLVNVRADGQISDRFALIKGTGLVVGSPDGGETLAGGATHEIRWATAGAVANVKLEYSIDDGATWKTIVASTPNTGTHAWKVPAVDTNLALVRVTDVANGANQDESNGTFAISATGPTTVIPYGATWKYEDTGENLGLGWQDPAYDDSTWPSGPAQLGYGDGDEATELQSSPVHPSYYFRTAFTLSSPVIAADLSVLHDDGVAVWINGTEVFSKYMGNGTAYGAYADAASSENEVDTTPVSPNPFVIGENVIAAIVKQSSATSSDVSFDLKLDVTLQPPVSTGGAGGAGTTSSGAMGGNGAGGNGGAGGSGGSDVGKSGCGCEAAGAPVTPYGTLAFAAFALVARGRRKRREEI